MPDAFKFIKENEVCTILSHKGNVFGVECPNFVELVVTSSDPAVPGNTATNTLEARHAGNRRRDQNPLFIDEGEKIQVDTRITGEYLGRAK